MFDLRHNTHSAFYYYYYYYDDCDLNLRSDRSLYFELIHEFCPSGFRSHMLQRRWASEELGYPFGNWQREWRQNYLGLYLILWDCKLFSYPPFLLGRWVRKKNKSNRIEFIREKERKKKSKSLAIQYKQTQQGRWPIIMTITITRVNRKALTIININININKAASPRRGGKKASNIPLTRRRRRRRREYDNSQASL